MIKFTTRQRLFVEYYLILMNAYQAAIKAGFAESTSSKKAPMWVGKSRDSCPKNMRHIWDAVQQAIAARSERLQIDADWVLAKAVQLYETSINDFLVTPENAEMPYFDLNQATDTQLAAIESLQLDTVKEYDGVDSNGDAQYVTVRKIKLTLSRKKDVLALIGKHVDVQAFKESVLHKHQGKIEHEHTVKDQMNFTAVRDKVGKHKQNRGKHAMH